MRLKYVSIAISQILRYLSIIMIIPACFSIYEKDYNSLLIFLLTGLISLVLGILIHRKKIDMEELNDLKKLEALFVVAVAWIFMCLVCSIPYLFYGLNVIDALFEGVSGITTTGATILQDFSLYPRTFFFWRSFTQWLGGMGVIVLFIAILPQFAIAGRQMFSAETPGPTEGKFTPRIKNSAAILWKMYVLFTILEIILLHYFGMPMFDAVCNSMSTIATGGFSPHPYSIMGYNSSQFLWIIMIFMFLSGTGFAMLYRGIIKRNISEFKNNDEFKAYLFLVAVLGAVIGAILYFNPEYNVPHPFVESFFQVISLVTTTGFASVDYTNWPIHVQFLLILTMFTGACAGSTSGGIKIVRILFIIKYIKREFAKIIHPNIVVPVKMNNTTVNSDLIGQMLSFVIFYILIFFISTLITTMIETNPMTAIMGTIATLGNIGPSFGTLGPMGNFSDLLIGTKLIFILNMLIGRLELIPFLAILQLNFKDVRAE